MQAVDSKSGFASEEPLDIALNVDFEGRIDIESIGVTLTGKDAEFWSGSYGTIWKDMALYVGADRYSLLDDTSDWHIEESTAIAREDQ